MPGAFVLLKCIAKAVVKNVVKGVVNLFSFGIGGDLLYDAWESWRDVSREEQRPVQAQECAQATPTDAKRIALEAAACLPEADQQRVVEYLQMVPARVRRTFSRPADPTGRTCPPWATFKKEDDLLPLLPPQAPIFRPGMRPLHGVDWELVELLGVGGFGEVWKASNPYLDGVAPVALKFCLDKESRERLLKHEAAVLNQVTRQGKHPGIVALLRTYLGADPPCLEYEFIEGCDLAGFLLEFKQSGGGLTAQQALRVIQRLAEIVSFAHRLSPPIVHRDLKPANILVQPHPNRTYTLKITDFGIGGLAAARAIAQSRSAARPDNFHASLVQGAYTEFYSSPQQMAGAPPDPSDDVYSLGVIWYQLLTGNLAGGAPTGLDWVDDLKQQGMTDEAVQLLASCFSHRAAKRSPDASALAERLAALSGPKESPVLSSTTPAGGMGEMGAAREVEVTVPGIWYCRPEARPTADWVAVVETPSKVLLRKGDSYQLEVDGYATDDELAGLVNLGGLPALHKIKLRRCKQVTDVGLGRLNGLTAMQELDLRGCKRVTDAGLAHLQGLTALQHLDLGGCERVTDAGLAQLQGLTALQYLDLRGCKRVTDAGLAHLRGLTAMQELGLSCCERVTDAGLAVLRSLTAIRGLALWSTAITDAGLAHLRGLTALQRLYLSSCKRVTDAGLSHLAALTNLRELDLGGCESVTDAGLANLRGLTALQQLSLAFCERVTDAGLAHIQGLTALRALRLVSTAITDAGLAHLRGLTAMQELVLSGCERVTDAGLAHLAPLTVLRELDLSDCKRVTNAGLAHLQGLTALQHLDLSDCKRVTDAGLAHLQGLTALQHLDLSDCKRVTDAGLAHLQGLTALQQLHLSGFTRVTDAGLAHLAALTDLRNLYLSGCACHGRGAGPPAWLDRPATTPSGWFHAGHGRRAGPPGSVDRLAISLLVALRVNHES